MQAVLQQLRGAEKIVQLRHSLALVEKHIRRVFHGGYKVAGMGITGILTANYPTASLMLHQPDYELPVFVVPTLEIDFRRVHRVSSYFKGRSLVLVSGTGKFF